MAELLIKAVDASHPDPAKDAFCYKRGDVVDVRENDFAWGAMEKLAPASGGQFAIIEISDVTRQQVINWVKTHWGTDVAGIDFEVVNGAASPIRRRRVKIDVSLIPAAVRQTLNTLGFYATTWAIIRDYIHNKQTNETASGLPIV
jgi:hypothetical protein